MEHSSLILFGRLLKGKNWDRIKIHREFKKRVDKSDYAGSDTDSLMRHFERMTRQTAAQ